jgi:hypothetical protein
MSKAERKRIGGITIPFLEFIVLAVRGSYSQRKVGRSDVKRN